MGLRSEELSLPGSSFALAIALLARLGDGFSVAPRFFQIADKRMRTVGRVASSFSNFVGSVFGSLVSGLQDLDGSLDAAYLVIAASELLKDWIIPEELENDYIKDRVLGLLELVLGEGTEIEKVDEEVAVFWEKVSFWGGRTVIPLSAYEALSELLGVVCGNKALYPESIEILTQTYGFFSILPFNSKLVLIDAIPFQIRYLFDCLSQIPIKAEAES